MNTEKETLIDQTIEEEWRQFQQVQNEGGRADCQNRPQKFYNMRAAQLKTWPRRLVESYRNDLYAAARAGDNLLFQKYAYMMKTTAPGQYEKVKDYLAEISEERSRIIREISEIHTRWTEEFDAAYPYLASRSRPETRDIGALGITSFRTYLEGELATYGNETLSLYYLFTMKCLEHDVNLTYMIRENMVVDSGFDCVEAAEHFLQEKSRRS